MRIIRQNKRGEGRAEEVLTWRSRPLGRTKKGREHAPGPSRINDLTPLAGGVLPALVRSGGRAAPH